MSGRDGRQDRGTAPDEDDTQAQRYGGDHVDFSSATFHAPVIGTQVVQMPPPLPTALHALPAPPPVLSGRGQELDELLGSLDPRRTATHQDGGGVVVSAVAGMGGVGKTALAAAAGALAQREGWFCAELFVDLQGYTPAAQPLPPEAALDKLLRDMGTDPVDIPAGVQERAGLYRSALAALSQADERGRPVLVVADNARDAAEVRPLLPGPGGHRLLATGRGGLHALSGAVHLDLDVLPPGAAADLLARALGCAPCTEGIAELARSCGFLPLALEIAAARIAASAGLTPGRLALRLAGAAARLERLSDRERSLRAVFDASFDQLDERQARMFLLLGSAPGPDTSTEAAAVLADLEHEEAEEVLEGLEAARLVASSRGGGRWAMHDLLADYTRARPRTLVGWPRAWARAQKRLLGHYTALARDASDRVEALPSRPASTGSRFADPAEAWAWLDAERATLVAAALAAPALKHPRAAVALPLRLAHYLDRRRRFEDLEAVSRSAQTAARTVGDQSGEACAFNNLSLALQGKRRFDEAIKALTRAREIAQRVGDAHGEARAFNNLGTALYELGRSGEAIDALTRARELYQRVEDAHGEAQAINNLGLASREAGRSEEAIKAHNRDLEYRRRSGDIHGEATVWNNLGPALQQAGRFEKAAEAAKRADTLYMRVRDENRRRIARDWLSAAGLEEAAKQADAQYMRVRDENRR
ncbi:tetratricopeptide repeat protein [Nocardiopsis sp. RSe5-2]|uniref:Tetratricopeptide repeat protein n=1 Tax=Nocardiopsis endophytica TaxID=3018445 RepID=A0ABT4TYX6_9ACTN|nr:tetratricopeptide repeat protein [Nocardiopsis endophytica]MDA2809895.1 tetratricopeptide repeat protein [Nocardiopsis endophytica]